MFKLFKPIIFFDLETTGTSIQNDRIIQIGYLKIPTDKKKGHEIKSMLVNPGIPIPKEATEVHGITDEMVKDKPTFAQISKSLNEQMFGCDLGGFNSDSFDIPILIEEFKRSGIDFPTWELNTIDGLKIERMINSHKLTETYERYFGKELESAHDASADTIATFEVFLEQCETLRHNDPEFVVSVENIDKLCQGEKLRFDLAGKCYIKEDVVYWSFGKNMNKPVLEDRSYLSWVLNSDFPSETKSKLTELIVSNK